MSKVADYAIKTTRGRQFYESAPTYRTEFQRDRDRIIHSSAFRRLEYKTQVFINHEGDLFRTRLTHSLEVAQIGRSVADALNLNIDLVEAICLAHDLGHTPFGHVGQDELNNCMYQSCGKHFEHNLQSLRIVDKLEERYVDFNGLNLTFETREGILKHCSIDMASRLGELGERFIRKQQPSLEAQLANIADELAYNYHDVDDGLRSKLISLEMLEEVTIIRENLTKIRTKYPMLQGRKLHKELVRQLISLTIFNLIENTKSNLEKHNISSIDAVRIAPAIVGYDTIMADKQRELKKFLHKNLYNHSNIMQLRYKSAHVIRELFRAYTEDAGMMPKEYQARIKICGVHRVVADYISGMTDRYAYRQYHRLFTVESI